MKPSQLSVARVTVVRGEGTLEETLFIDDYISTSEQALYICNFACHDIISYSYNKIKVWCIEQTAKIKPPQIVNFIYGMYGCL